MRDVINKGPPTDGGYPADNDLHQMSDDGCPLGPDPARWSDPEWRDDPAGGEETDDGWRDDLGLWDTFDDEVRMGFPAGDPAAPPGAASGPAANVRPVAPVARPPASQDLHPEDSAPVSGGGFFVRAFIAAALIIGSLVLLVWYTSR